MTRNVLGIRWKLLGYFGASAVLAIVTVIVLLVIAMFLYGSGIEPFPTLIHILFEAATQLFPGTIGPFIVLFFVAVTLFFVFFFLLTGGIIKQVLRISDSVQTIANGNLDHRLDVSSNDELGELADNINRMTVRLHQSMEEERAAERSKRELITSVSHDLRTPLTSILGYLDLIERDQYRDEIELRQYTHLVHNKALRLQVLIEDLFEYTRVTHGGMKLDHERLDIGQLLEQLVTESGPLTEQEGVVCRTHPSKGKIEIDADGNKIARVFDNLITNAVRYGREGKFIDIFWRREEKEAVIEVTNYGEPIPAADLPYIFDRFYRVEKSRSNDSGGSGLGLAIAKNIIELHGGSIRAFSDSDRTVFETRFPLAAGKQTESSTHE